MRKNTWLKTAICLLLAAALWACNTGSDEAPRERRFTDLGPSLESDRARLEAARDAVAKDTLHDSATVAAWAATLDSLAAELNDIEHDFRIVGPRPEGEPNRERDREAALAAGLRAFEERFAGTAPNRVPKGFVSGPTINLNGKPFGNIAIKVFGGTSTTTEWPPPGASGELPETLVVVAEKSIAMHLRSRSVKDWHFSVYPLTSIPVLDTAALANWSRLGRDSVSLGPDEFDSLASGGQFKFNLRIRMQNKELDSRIVFLSGLGYDKTTRTFTSLDTIIMEDILNFTAEVKVSYARDSIGNPLSTYLFIPGSPYFVEVHTTSYKVFPIPYGSFDFRMLALPADWKSQDEVVGRIYSVISEELPVISSKVFHPVAVYDSLLIRRSE